jgi:succinylglutamate desuccinylase
MQETEPKKASVISQAQAAILEAQRARQEITEQRIEVYRLIKTSIGDLGGGLAELAPALPVNEMRKAFTENFKEIGAILQAIKTSASASQAEAVKFNLEKARVTLMNMGVAGETVEALLQAAEERINGFKLEQKRQEMYESLKILLGMPVPKGANELEKVNNMADVILSYLEKRPQEIKELKKYFSYAYIKSIAGDDEALGQKLWEISFFIHNFAKKE